MRIAAWWLAAAVLVAGCEQDREPAPQTGSTGASSGDGNGSTFVMQPDLGAAETTGPAWPLPSDDDLLTCVHSCEGPWDCCPPGTEGMCPGPAYPYNYMCIQEMCVVPPCTGDADCPGAGQQCRPVDGWPTCVLPCDADETCTAADADLTCSGTDDDGSAYCFEHCALSSLFCGAGSCDEASGRCVCTGDGQCLDQWICV